MELSGTPPGKGTASTSFSFRYNANNEELEELFEACEDDPPTPQFDSSPAPQSENASPKRGDKTTSILDKYFKSIRSDKDKEDKPLETKDSKSSEEKGTPPKEVSSSPMKDYLNRLGKRSTSESSDVKEVNETWKIFHDFKFKIAQAVEDMKTRSLEETKEKNVPRDNSISDSEESSAIKDSDLSVGDTENQVSSLESSMQNLSEMTNPITAKATEKEVSLPVETKNNSDSSDDTHRNIAHSETADLTKDILNFSNIMEVESGVEALEDGIDGFCEVPPLTPECPYTTPLDVYPSHTAPPPVTPTNFGTPPSKKKSPSIETPSTKKALLFNFTLYFLTIFIFINYLLFPESNIWNGFLLGIWFFYFVSNLKQWVLDNYFCDSEQKENFFQLKRSSAMPMTYTIPSIKEHRPVKKIEGWINHYRSPDYDPYSYHVNKTTTAFMKLEGCNLRISYTKTKIRKRALWDEKIEKVDFYQHRLYNLTGARIILLPKGLVRRRQWSKKYPICIILNENEKIQVLEKESVPSEKKSDAGRPDDKKKSAESPHDVESIETNTSPEKKRKFVWRRRDKRGSLEKETSIPHSEGEVGKEGLRHRLVRKMHRDKKTDNVSTSTEPQENTSQSLSTEPVSARSVDQLIDSEVDFKKSLTSTNDEEDLDESELSRIKEVLEETELDTGGSNVTEGEWSIHVKDSKDKHSCLFFFTRTGRDKHEWFRRISSAIEEARTPSPEAVPTDEKPTTDGTVPDHKEGIEMAVYKLSEKENIAFTKSSTLKLPDVSTESVTICTPAKPIYPTFESHEKSFWPYLLKIIQQLKTSSSTCDCRMLPAEVTWLNTMMARVVYDMMRNQTLLGALQTRVQKKLHTLKLPSFMSPLMVTELSVAGACPLIERVSNPAWDERGVWLDADVRYDGGAYITILTQINLMKLKERNSLEEQLLTAESLMDPDITVAGLMAERRKRKPAIYDSEMEDSAESSDDNDDLPMQPVDSDVNVFAETAVLSGQSDTSGQASSSSKKKFMRMVDKIASNKYFQQVTDYKYVKRAMEGLSNTDIKLQLELQGLEGRIVFNLPPPPHDRLWVGFRSNPQLVLKARPAVGARALRFAHISNWIEQRLIKEFEKVLVLPNMEDIVIDLMSPTPIEFE